MGVTPPPTVSADVQFPSAAAGKLYIEKLTDPSGAPLDVLNNNDVSKFEGRVELPAWLVGKGVVTIYADEIGGKFDDKLADTTFPVTGGTSPGVVPYGWTVSIPAGTVQEVDKMYQIGVVFMLQTSNGDHTDIAAFYDLGAYLVV